MLFGYLRLLDMFIYPFLFPKRKQWCQHYWSERVKEKLLLSELFCSVPYTDTEIIILEHILKRQDEMIFFSHDPDSVISRCKN